jgi:cell division protein FtsL
VLIGIITRLLPAMRKPIFPGTRFLWMDLLLMIAVVALAIVGVVIFWYDERRMKQRYYEQKVRESLEEE